MISVEEQIRRIEQDRELLIEPSILTSRIKNMYEVVVYIQKRANEIHLLEHEYIEAMMREYESNHPEFLQEGLYKPVYDYERLAEMKKIHNRLPSHARAIKELLENKLVCKNLRRN